MSVKFEELDKDVVVGKFDAILSRGLCTGVGSPDGQVCIEAAIALALELQFNDEPECVEPVVRAYKIRLNDSIRWESPASRARGLRELGIAQIGSKGVVDGAEFAKRMAEKTVRVLVPTLFRDVLKNPACLAAADRCEREGTWESALAAKDDAAAAGYAADAAAAAAAAYAAAAAAAYAAGYAADAAAAAYAYDYAADAYAAAAAAAAAAASAAAYADAADADAAYARSNRSEKYLLLSARLALETLRELKSPGCAWLTKEGE